MSIPRAEAIKLAYEQIQEAAKTENPPAAEDPIEKDRSLNRARRFAGAVLGAPQGLGAAFLLGDHLPREITGGWSAPVGAALGLGAGGLVGYNLPGLMGAMTGLEAGAPIGSFIARALAIALDRKKEEEQAMATAGALLGGLPMSYFGYRLMHPSD